MSVVELLVVLVVIGLGLALAMPLARRTATDGGPEATARRIAGDLRSARLAAISGNRTQAVVFDLGRRSYAAGAPPATAGGRPLPPGLSIRITTPGSERLAADVFQVRFFPTGAATRARIELADGRQVATVTVDWLTGQVRRLPSR